MIFTVFGLVDCDMEKKVTKWCNFIWRWNI